MKIRRLSNRAGTASAVVVLLIVNLAGTMPALADNAAVGPKLTSKLMQLLKSEMTQIAASTSAITTALATGDHAAVAKEATRIANGFILKESLTQQDKKDLKIAVPTAFLKLDATFHSSDRGQIGPGREQKRVRIAGVLSDENAWVLR